LIKTYEFIKIPFGCIAIFVIDFHFLLLVSDVILLMHTF
jgi:hypothetical protein